VKMKILIIGNSENNSRVYEYLTNNGMEVTVISDVYRLRSVTGEAGNFTAIIKDDEGKKDIQITAGFIILIEQTAADPVMIDGLPALPLYQQDKGTQDKGTDLLSYKEPVVFLLDYFCESPMSATVCALSNAVALARKKRKVFYLAKFIRTAGRGIETLYAEARETGVTFIKYEDLQITSDVDKEEFSITVSDGDISLDIVTKIIYADGGRDAGESFMYAAKKLGLTTNKNGCLTEDTYFLTPTLTSRRGVYHITRDLAAESLDEGLDFICTFIKNDINNTLYPDIPPFGITVIDGNKCIFCYTCFRACPHAALQPDHGNSQMQCLSAACFGCGTCVGLCPANAIKLENDKPGTGSDIRNSLVICCLNSGGAALENTDRFDVKTVPCGGLIDEGMLSDNLALYDKVIAVVCPDDACRHFCGNKYACGHVNRFRDLMEAAGLSAEKVQIIKASIGMPGVLKEVLHDSSRVERY